MRQTIEAAGFIGSRMFMIDDPALCRRLILCYRNRDETMLLTLQLFSHVRSFIGRPDSFHEATLISTDNAGHFFASTNSLHVVLDSKRSTFHQLAPAESGKPASLDHLVQFHRDRIGQGNYREIKSHRQAEITLDQFHQLTKDELLENGIFEGEFPPKSPSPVTSIRPTVFEASSDVLRQETAVPYFSQTVPCLGPV